MPENIKSRIRTTADAKTPVRPVRMKKVTEYTVTPQQQKLRLVFIAIFLGLWVLGVGTRLVYLQVVQYGKYTQLALRQQIKTVDVSPRRGVVYDRNMNELAMTIGADSAYAIPDKILDKSAAAKSLATTLGLDPRDLLNKFEGSHQFAWVARKMDADMAKKVHALNLSGIFYARESRRYYPKGELAAAALGFVGTDDQGLGGIEKSFENQLRGRSGKMMVSVDARQKSLDSNERHPQAGDNVVLTLDEKIQYIAERELERAVEQTKAESGMVVVQDPKTGEILALAARPTFNPNDFRNSEPGVLKNHAVSDIYEPGSTFKIVTIAAALEEKLTTPDELIDCQMGSIKIFGRVIHDDKPFGVLTVAQIMQHSSDVGAIKLGLRLGDKRFSAYIERFGFGTKTGVELPGETRGMTKPVERWQKSSVGSIAMGQEVGVSALQLVSMVSTIANDGMYVAPKIVRGTFATHTGAAPIPQNVEFAPGTQRRVVSQMTAVQIKRMLEDTVIFGTGKKAILDGYTSAGKTGTAQKVDPATGTYSKWKHIASFSGFAPVMNPNITVYVVLDSPVGAHHGGDVAAPVWAKITQQVLAYRNVPHDADVKNLQRQQIRASAKPDELSEGSDDRVGEEYVVSDSSEPNAAVPEPISALQTAMTRHESVPKGKAAMMVATFHPQENNLSKAYSVKSDTALMNQPQPLPSAPNTRGTVIVDVGNGPPSPQFAGKTVRQVIEIAQQAGVDVDVIGSGVAVEQMPPAGQRIPPGMHITVRFAR